MSLRIGSIIGNSAAEMEGYFSTLIFLQGCNRSCGYCFNKDLIDRKGGREYTFKELADEIMKYTFDECIVFTGGDPHIQCIMLERFFWYCAEERPEIHMNKRWVLETSYFDPEFFRYFNKVLLTLKTWDLPFNQFDARRWYEDFKNDVLFMRTDVCFVCGHEQFDEESLIEFVEIFRDLPIEKYYVRHWNGGKIPATLFMRFHMLGKKLCQLEKMKLL